MRLSSGVRGGCTALLLVLGLEFAASGLLHAQEDAFVVKTSGGAIRGMARDGGGARFLGIPYAQPPLGELRWREPQLATPWKGVREANSFSAPCSQPDLGDWNRHDAQTGQEDCLYLNVVTPEWPAKKPLPVMFWIHGGGNMGGTAMSALYNDGTLPNHGVVLVTVNYRLGVFGFLAHRELTSESAHHGSGNYGLMDQILALRWVIENISRFGGDAKNITVFGQSAGAQDTGILMSSNAKGLFQKAIAESGAPFFPGAQPLKAAEEAGAQLANGLGAPQSGAIAFLRGLSADELQKRLRAHPTQTRLGPDVDGWVVTRSPEEVFAAGTEAPIPLLFGTTTHEFGVRESGMPASPVELRKVADALFGSFAEQELAAYGLADGGAGRDDALYGKAGDQFAADLIFRCPATTEGIWHTAAHHAVYEYEFNHAVPGQEAQGAVHSTELSFVFGYYPKQGNLAGAYTANDYKIADQMESYFTNFARSGDPNGEGLPAWPRFGTNRAYLKFTQPGPVTTAADLRGAECKVYRDMLAERVKQAQLPAAARKQ